MKQFLPRLAFSLFAAIFVAAQAAPGPAHGMGEGRDGGPFFHALEKAKDDLKLTPEQEAKWQDAQAAGKAAREAMHQDHERMHAMMDAERKKDVMDLAKLDQQMEAMMESGRKAREAARDKWLAVYDSLSADQKRIASKHIQDAMSRMDKMREHMKARMKEHMQHDHAKPPATPS